MEQLLSIKTIPISLKYDITPASVEIRQPQPKATVTRERGGFQMESEQPQVRIDTYNCRKDYGYKNYKDLSRDFVQRCAQDWQSDLNKTLREGEAMSNALAEGNDKIIPQLAYQSFSAKSIEAVLTFIPKERPEISVKEGKLDIKYTPDKLNYDWEVMKNTYKYTPGSIKITVEQMPRVIVEYLGDPIYVPPSADPNYKPVDQKV